LIQSCQALKLNSLICDIFQISQQPRRLERTSMSAEWSRRIKRRFYGDRVIKIA